LAKERKKEKESIPKTKVLGTKTAKTMSKHTEDKEDNV